MFPGFDRIHECDTTRL